VVTCNSFTPYKNRTIWHGSPSIPTSLYNKSYNLSKTVRFGPPFTFCPGDILFSVEFVSMFMRCILRWFLPRDAMHKRGLWRHAVSVRPSVWVSVTFVYSFKTNSISSIFFHYRVAILVFPYHTLWQYSDRDPITMASNAGVVGKDSNFDQYLAFWSMTGEVRSTIHDWRCSSRLHLAWPHSIFLSIFFLYLCIFFILYCCVYFVFVLPSGVRMIILASCKLGCKPGFLPGLQLARVMECGVKPAQTRHASVDLVYHSPCRLDDYAKENTF